MKDIRGTIEEARALLASGREPKAVQVLADAIEATDDPELLRRIHEVALDGHAHVGGFQKIHWHALVIDAETRLAEVEKAHTPAAG